MMRSAIFLQLLSPVIFIVMATGSNSSDPVGVMMCKLKCQGIIGCVRIDYVLKYLQCYLLPGRSFSSRIPHATRLDVKVASDERTMECPLMYKWMITRKASYTCVDPGTASAKTNRDSFGASGFSGKERLLTVTTSNSNSTSTSKLFVLELNSYRWQPAGQFQGDVVAMDYSENVLYVCQRNPGGLFTTHVQVGRNPKKPEKIIDGACTSVAVDPVVVRAFFINSSGLWSYNLVSKIITKLPVALRGRANKTRVIVETREHVVYVYGRYKKDIRKYDHSGKFLTSFPSAYPFRDAVIYSGQSHSTLYCTYTMSPSVVNRYSLPGWARTTHFKVTDAHRLKFISNLAVADNKIFLTHGRFLRVLDSKTLREDSTLVFETFGEWFRNLLVIEGQNLIL